MAAEIPTTEPTSVTAGDTAEWTRSFPDYPAPDWVLSYAFLGINIVTSGPILITATADDEDHLVSLGPATTELWVAGEYNGQGYVTKTATGERRHVWSGVLFVTPNFVNAGQIDTRSKARRIVDALEQTMERWGQQQVSRAVIEGVSFEFRTWSDLKDARDYWLGIASDEEQAVTGGWRRCILAQFTTPQ